ncbi:unnamed protein product [Anisakis simplex]|uniref:Splicing factor U2af 38 kDa subunit (inferred by orthology to a D. melanogaster protein) n=1 Tax=Anisakis simplex TaxID=6269 RepID=A0A0M3K8R2_ANISI|nr:unnamed protein product [Anisakis simplex]
MFVLINTNRILIPARVKCSFYFKIGACRHGNKCSRLHIRPKYSQTILLNNFYKGSTSSSTDKSKEELQREFDEFYREVYMEIDGQYGRIDEMNVCENVGEHMLGNVYIKFRYKWSALRAVRSLNNRWFNGYPIDCELSPVVDFRDACCRQYEMGECNRGGFCNFMHLKKISWGLKRKLIQKCHKQRRRYSKKFKRSNSDSNSSSSSSDYFSDNDSLPKKYQPSISSEESSWSIDEVHSLKEDQSSTTPLAFRSDRYPSDLSDQSSFETDSDLEAHKQLIRRQKWEELRDKLHIDEKWDEDREQSFIFSLL